MFDVPRLISHFPSGGPGANRSSILGLGSPGIPTSEDFRRLSDPLDFAHKIKYEPLQRSGAGMFRLGIGEAVAIGARVFALKKLL
jgi:hypothetical protein